MESCLIVLLAAITLWTQIVSSEVSNKKGVSAWAGDFRCDDWKVLNNMSWWYDWKSDLSTYDAKVTNRCPPSNHHMPEFVPMAYRSKWDNRIHLNFTSEAKYILGFNEPDMAVQTNKTPEEVAALWPDIERNANGRPLVSPAPAHHDFTWLDEFFRLCNNCRVDYIAAHAYNCDANHIMTYLQRMHNRYHKKIWLTEFACPYSTHPNDHLHLMQTLLPKLEAADYVFRYSWFMARMVRIFGGGFMHPSAALLHNGTSTLTRLGHFYNDFQPGNHATSIVG